MRAIHKSILGRITTWMHAHHTATFAIAGVGIVGAASLTAAAVLYQRPQQVIAPSTNSKKTPSPSPAPVYYSALTGVKVPDQASTQQAVTGVMIENSPSARPQSGLKSAGVVFEAIAEGGITRFLALYQEAKPQLVGPVRSVRLYFVDWIAPFQASVAHIGGSKFALAEVRNGSYRDIDQFFNASTYWRATDRYAPHNVYTNFQRLDALNTKKGFSSSVFTAWPRQDDKPAKTPTASNIAVTISSAPYNSRYAYNPATNTYTRYIGGAQHKDREAGDIAPNVVIVMDVTETRVMEDGWREQIATTGSGRARVFQNGLVTEGTWTKKDRGSQISFTDSSGAEIPLNRGQTWITTVPANKGGKVTWTTK